MTVLLAQIYSFITFFAIAGGGGSSSGGGGGGGSFSGGSSSSSSGGSGGGGDFTLVDLFWMLGTFAFIGVMFWLSYQGSQVAAKRLKERREKIKQELALAVANDVMWDESSIEAHARDTFLQYQKDWSAFDLDSMRKYMTPAYYRHNQLMMGAMKLLQRQNDVQTPRVLSAEVTDMTDSPNDAEDRHTVRMSVFVHDVLNDTKDTTQLFAQNLSATEYYKFERKGKRWLFAGIDQATANPAMMNQSLKEFAAKNDFFYSLDWGHLLLPRRGQLFGTGTFGISDINNHIIGWHKETIIQIYTYVPKPASPSTSYLISQVAVPKSYGNIVVRKRKGWFSVKPPRLRRITLEWGDFNKVYDVFASDKELATSFELLNPTFMEQLHALPFEINIEVVDNIVYLYTPEMGSIRPDHYEAMLGVLQAAFKEMKM